MRILSRASLVGLRPTFFRDNYFLVNVTVVAATLDLSGQCTSGPALPFLHADRHSFAITFNFSPRSQVSASLRRNPNVVFARRERSCAGALQNFKVQGLDLASLGFDIADRGFDVSIHQQFYAVSSLFQRGIIITTIGSGVNLSNFICIAAL